MASTMDIDSSTAEQTAAAAAAPEQKGTTRGVEAITESPRRRSSAVAEPAAPVTPQEDDRTQGNQKKRRSGVKNWLKVMGEKSNGATGKALEQVDILGTKPKLMSKAATATKKADKGKQEETLNPTPATRTKAASRKSTISFADQQKKKTWKYKIVLSWAIVVKYKENSTTKAVLETALGQILKYLRKTAGGSKSDAAILPRLSASKDAMPILSAEDFPKHIVTWKDNYAEMDPKAYNNIYKGKSKKIQGCFTMGFNVEGNGVH
jgi:hypothetical protein